MKTYTTIFFLFYFSTSFAGDLSVWKRESKFNEAAKHTQKALLSYPEIKKISKKLEKEVYKRVPASKETMGVIGSTILTLSKGSLDTKVIRKMDFKFLGGKARPNLNYNFKDGNAETTVNINWNF